MIFKKIDIESRKEINKFLKIEDRKSCAYCFTDIFIWKDKYKTEFCIEDNCLYMRQFDIESNMYFYYAPIIDNSREQTEEKENDKDNGLKMSYGNNNENARNNHEVITNCINKIIIDSIDNNYQFCFGNINQELSDFIIEEYGNIFEIEHVRDFSDYIYNSTDLINLSGKKFHKKKNLLNKFKRVYDGCYEYRDITSNDVKDILEFNKIWCESNLTKDAEDMADETKAIKLAMENFDALKLQGGMLLVNNKIIAYTLGSEITRDTFGIQIEKALSEYAGAYQMINNAFAKNNLEKYKFINREEDLGIEGLRKAKMSYNPVIIEDYIMAKCCCENVRKTYNLTRVKSRFCEVER